MIDAGKQIALLGSAPLTLMFTLICVTRPPHVYVYNCTNPILAAAAADLSQLEYCRLVGTKEERFQYNLYSGDREAVSFAMRKLHLSF
jgi:hypothetical protein